MESRDIAERTRSRITRRLMPFLFVLYVFNYMNASTSAKRRCR